jgi:hypothetical protein
MNKQTKGILIVASTLGLIGAVYYFFIYKKGKPEIKNYDDLKSNLGNFLDRGDMIQAIFNEKKHKAQFYPNNRFIIAEYKSTEPLKKGTYLNGGKKLIIDNGRTIESNSVWANLLETLK